MILKPFGTLGAQKKKLFKDATICLFVFDILMLNGESLMSTPMIKRRKILEKHITVFSFIILLILFTSFFWISFLLSFLFLFYSE
jgi:ATP-dependent DNA ligase